MASRRGVLILGGAALTIIGLQRGLPYLRHRFAPLQREPIATAPGFLRLVGVNGVTTAILETADPTPGFIALQHVGKGTVKFRNIELRTL